MRNASRKAILESSVQISVLHFDDDLIRGKVKAFEMRLKGKAGSMQGELVCAFFLRGLRIWCDVFLNNLYCIFGSAWLSFTQVPNFVTNFRTKH